MKVQDHLQRNCRVPRQGERGKGYEVMRMWNDRRHLETMRKVGGLV